MSRISDSEKEFISSSIQIHKYRLDGRSPFDSRQSSLQTKVLPSASGSARVRIGIPQTEVVVGIKLQLGEPLPDYPETGYCKFSVECSPSAGSDISNVDLYASKLASVLADVYKPSTNLEMMKQMSIIPGRSCWIFHVDALVLSLAGNVMLALSLAVRAALQTAVLPKVQIYEADGDQPPDIEIIEDQSSSTSIDCQNAPIIMTLAKIGKIMIIDPSTEEEDASDIVLNIAVNKSGHVCGLQKSGNCGLKLQDLEEAISMAESAGTLFLQRMDEFMEAGDSKNLDTLDVFIDAD